MALKPWVKLPTGWIQDGGLKDFRWGAGNGSNNAAALMTLAVIAHHADEETGIARLTYDDLCTRTTLSRAKISGGLTALEGKGIISRPHAGRSIFQLRDYDPAQGWGKLPARKLYSLGRISAFQEISLRSPTSLIALKLYFLFVARRDNTTNLANISYDKIMEYSGISRDRIKSGLNVLAANNLVHIEHLPTQHLDVGISNAYRLVHLEPRLHMGTRGRQMISETEGGSIPSWTQSTF